jgi:predicted SAM-dependent methyltransferase
VLKILTRLKKRLLVAPQVRNLLAASAEKRIILGAGGICSPGWVATDMDFLDIRAPADWERLAQPGTLTAILAEHVWEHLAPADARQAARNCHRFLKPGGHLRVAVPDGLHPDPRYVESVRPGGSGAGADDHKLLYRHHSFADVFRQAGFEVRAQEHFDEGGKFHFREWDPRDGMIWRSLRYDQRNRDGKPNYTSIILDAVKSAGTD